MFLWACGPGFFLLTDKVFKGHAARAFSPSGQVFASRRVTFFLRARDGKAAPWGSCASPPQPPRGQESNQKKTAPCGAFRLTRNPLGAFLLRSHQRGSRDTVQNLERVSIALCIQPRVFDTRLSNNPRANFALLYVNPRVDTMQRKLDTPTALYSRLLKAGGWLQKLLLTRLIFCTVSRDPR